MNTAMGKVLHQTNYFETADHLKLFEQSWRPVNSSSVVVLLHGFAEHSGRYQWIAQQLVESACSGYAIDLRGHGKSEGERCFIESFDEYLQDLDCYLKSVQEKEPGKPVFLLSHSMGGAISVLYCLRKRSTIAGLILCSPYLEVSNIISPQILGPLMLLSNIFPRLPTIRLNSSYISKDQDVVDAYNDDPLIYHNHIYTKFAVELIRAVLEIQSNLSEINLPLIILHGSEDHIASVAGSKKLFEISSSKDKQIKLFPGCFHELLNEPEKDNIMVVIKQWLTQKNL